MPKGRPQCEFCGAELEDMMLGFLDHIEASEGCRAYWIAWRENVRRESGGT